MSLFTLLAALMFEQFRPLPQGAFSDRLVARIVLFARSPGDRRIGWLLAVVGGGAIVGMIASFLHSVFSLLAFVFGVFVLYGLLAPRREEAAFVAIERALAEDEPEQAAARLAAWCGQEYAEESAEGVARLAMEHAVLRAHRQIFGVLLWFVLLGPAGALAYRLAAELARAEIVHDQGEETFARRLFVWIDWLPARISALAFSVIGNFEDAMYCWRTQATLWPDTNAGVVLAAASGALGVRLGMPVHEAGYVVDRPELGLHATADVNQMSRVARMLWRVLVLIVLVVALVTIAGWVSY